jgi:hypothetical protein
MSCNYGCASEIIHGLEETYEDLKDSNSMQVRWNIKISWRFCDEEDLKTTCEILNINAESEEFSEISKKIMNFLV